MKRLRAAPLLALALAAACSDDPTGPELATSVEIVHLSESFDERTIRISETVQLSAFPLDASGRDLTGRRVRWSTSDRGVAVVDSSGLVTGMGLGTALIVATADATADTARVNVATPVSGAVECAPGRPGLALEVGAMHHTSGWESPDLCLEGGAKYLLVPFHASSTSGKLALSVEAGGSLLPDPIGLASRTPSATLSSTPRPDEAFHLRLREQTLPGLARRMGAMSAGSPEFRPRFSRTAAVPSVGDQMRLNVEIGSSDGCSDPDYRAGRVVAVTARAVVVADTANPGGGFTEAEYRAFGTAFDEVVHPLNVQHFGEPSDLDGNGRAIIFFTSAVNDLTRAGSGSYIGGFFYDRDLFPRSGSGACAGSNAAEMFYMMVPDPIRALREPAFEKESVRAHTLAVIGHEFQHLINASRRLHVHGATAWEESWLNEGLSHIAEELLYYRVSGLGSEKNEDGTSLPTEAAWRALEEYQLQNFERYIRFLRAPQSSSAIVGDDLSTRGAIWNFLRYAADRRSGSERDLWYRLANSGSSGMDNLREALGVDPLDWVQDWSLSLYLDDSGLPAPDRYLQPSWNLRELIPRLGERTGRSSYASYPLRILQFAPDRYLGLDLPGGASGFIRVEVPAGGRAALRITSGGLPAPEKLRLTVIRIE